MNRFVFLSLLFSTHVFATGLQSTLGENTTYVDAINFDLDMHERYVSGVMDVQLSAHSGTENTAELRFPLPQDAVLHKAELFIPQDEKWVTAETIGRREGSQIYTSLVQQQLDPLLIQSIGTDFYRAKIYPITANGFLHLRVHYAHMLENVENGDYRLRIPFANKDATPSTPTNAVTVNLNTDANYWTAQAWQLADEMATPSTVDLAAGTAQLSLPNFEMAKDVTLDLQPKQPFAEVSALAYQPTENLGVHIHTHWQPDFSAYPNVVSQPRNVVFVIDISGSMMGDKIVQARKAVINSLESLNASDRFGLVAFDSDVYVFQHSMTRGDYTQEAIQWVSQLKAGGSTAMMNGLKAGAAVGVSSANMQSIDLLLLTDGRPNVGSSTAAEMLQDLQTEMMRLERGIRIFTVGIGQNLDQTLLNKLSQATQGEATFALDDNEITGQVAALFDRVRGGGVSNVAAMIEGGNVDNTDFTWLRLFPNNPISLAAKGSTDIQLLLTGEVENGNSINLTASPRVLDVPPVFSQIAAPLAAKAWANQLERQVDTQGESNILVEEAVKLARTYGIITRYSSFMALRDEALYVKQGIARIERDPAGIALQPIVVSNVDENQIGGAGTDDEEACPSCDMFAPVQPQPVIPPSIPVSSVLMDATTSGSSVANSPAKAGGTSIIPLDLNVEEEVSMLPASAYCGYPVLSENWQLYIPYLVYEGNEYWAKLQMHDQAGDLTLKVLDYGQITYSAYQTGCQRVRLSSEMQLTMPLLMYDMPTQDIKFIDVKLALLSAQPLTFKVVDYSVE